MVSVSLCMIVKDEEAVLSRCLTSVGDFADEIIIVDTGSKDRTKEIAGRFTDKIYDFAWRDDFAAARNFAFEKGTGDYLFWLDADDVIPREELTKLKDLKASQITVPLTYFCSGAFHFNPIKIITPVTTNAIIAIM